MPAPIDSGKRQRILDAALKKFSAYGFARTAMADIAEGADMSRPALYQHFENKEEIFRATLDRSLGAAATMRLPRSLKARIHRRNSMVSYNAGQAILSRGREPQSMELTSPKPKPGTPGPLLPRSNGDFGVPSLSN